MKTTIIVASAVLLVFSGQTLATEYIYRVLMADTPEFKMCQAQPKATQNASKPSRFKRYTEIFCRSQGYGWHLEKVKEKGRISCEACNEQETNPTQQYRCRLQDIVVTCKRIKPGTVGMLPGQY